MSGVFSGILHAIEAPFEIVGGAISSLVSLIVGLLSNVAELFQQIIALLLGNIVIIGVLAAVVFGLLAYQGRQGKSIGAKKRI